MDLFEGNLVADFDDPSCDTLGGMCEGGRRKEEGGRRKEEGGRRKEEETLSPLFIRFTISFEYQKLA